MADKKEKEETPEDRPISTLVCKDCGTEVSGPDEASLKEAASRHSHSTGHGSMNRAKKEDDSDARN